MTEGSDRALVEGVRANDLAEVTRELGPVVTAYVTTEQDIENARQRSEARWRSLRNTLEGEGASAEALDAIEPFVADAHLRGSCLAAIAGEGGLRHVEHGNDMPPKDLGWWSPVPRLGRVLAWRQGFPPHIVVLSDREGADIYIPRYGGSETVHREAGGEAEVLQRVNAGGWSQRRYQQRAQAGWEENAEDVARELTALAEHVEPRLLVVAGDVRSVQMLRDELHEDLTAMVQVVDGGRSRDGSGDAVWERVRELVEVLAARETESLLETFREEAGQRDLAARGADATVQALARAQVEVLLVHDDPDDERSGWVGPSPEQVARRGETLREIGIDPTEARLVDAAIRAALGTGARVRMVGPDDVPDGLSAILRWSG